MNLKQQLRQIDAANRTIIQQNKDAERRIQADRAREKSAQSSAAVGSLLGLVLSSPRGRAIILLLSDLTIFWALKIAIRIALNYQNFDVANPLVVIVQALVIVHIFTNAYSAAKLVYARTSFKNFFTFTIGAFTPKVSVVGIITTLAIVASSGFAVIHPIWLTASIATAVNLIAGTILGAYTSRNSGQSAPPTIAPPAFTPTQHLPERRARH